MRRPAPIALLSLCLALAGPAVAAPGAAPAAAPDPIEATVSRCFELRTREPADAVALAETTLARGEPAPDVEIRLQACLARAAALMGDDARTAAAAARIDALLVRHPMTPEFQLRALSNAGAALHTVGRIHEALDFYGRAYEVAARDESDRAQITTLINVGAIYSEELGAPEVAETYFARAEAIEAGTDHRDPTLPYNRGLNFLRMGRDAEALAAFTEVDARAVASGHEVVRDRARAERLALQAGEAGLDRTRRELETIARRQLDSDPAGSALTRLRLSRLALDDGDAAEALEQALAARAAVSDGPFGSEARTALAAEIAAREALSQWREAYTASETLRRLETERLRSQQLTGLAGLQARLEDTRSAQELERLQDERRLETLRLDNARRLRNGAVAAFFLLALLAAGFVFYQRRVNRKLERLSTVDSLTGLLNRRAGELALQEAGATAPDGDRRAAVFLVDVDRFKEFNDRFGHATGDDILAATAGRLRGACRPGDVVARWGGEEFLVVCRGLDADGAAVVAERLRKAAAAAIREPGAADPVSVSIGFASLPFLPGEPGPEAGQAAVSVADRALYAAKHGGRDTWVGLWGLGGDGGPLAEALADPEAAARAGGLRILAKTTPVSWPAAPG